MAGGKTKTGSIGRRQLFVYPGVHCLDSFGGLSTPKLYGYLRCATSAIWRDLANPKSITATHAKAGQLIVSWHSSIEEIKNRKSSPSEKAKAQVWTISPTFNQLFEALEDNSAAARLDVLSTNRPAGWYLEEDDPATWWWILTGFLIIKAAPEHFDFGHPRPQCSTRPEVKRYGISLGDWHRVFLHMRAFQSEFGFFSSLDIFLSEERRSIRAEKPRFPQATKLVDLTKETPTTTLLHKNTSSSSTQPAVKMPFPVVKPLSITTSSSKDTSDPSTQSPENKQASKDVPSSALTVQVQSTLLPITQPAEKKQTPKDPPPSTLAPRIQPVSESPIPGDAHPSATALQSPDTASSSPQPKTERLVHNDIASPERKPQLKKNKSVPSLQPKAEEAIPSVAVSPVKKPQLLITASSSLERVKMKRPAPSDDTTSPAKCPRIDDFQLPADKPIPKCARTSALAVPKTSPAIELAAPKTASTRFVLAETKVLDPRRRDLVTKFKHAAKKMPLQKRKDMAKDPEMPWYLLEHLKEAIEEGEKLEEQKFTAEKEFLSAWGVDVDGDTDVEEEG